MWKRCLALRFWEPLRAGAGGVLTLERPALGTNELLSRYVRLVLAGVEVWWGSYGVRHLAMLKSLRWVGGSGEEPRYAPASRANFPRREDGCRTLARSKNEVAVKKSGVTLPILSTSLTVPVSSNPVCVIFVSFLLHSPKEEPTPARLCNLLSSLPKPQVTPIMPNQPTRVCTRPRLTS